MESSLSPDVVAAIDDLEVAARLVVEGMRTGGHRSPFRGPGTEFQQHRPYRAGDDLRHLDWKLFARSDRLFTRQFRETTDFSLQLVVDSSASMAYPPHGLSKLRYAKILAASIAYLVSGQGSAVGLSSANDNGFSYLPARSGTLHRSALIARLDALSQSRDHSPLESLRHTAELLRRRGLIVVMSDFYDDEEAMLRELRAIAGRGHDVIMMQILSDDELTFDYARESEMEDLETGQRRLVDPAAIRAGYREALDAFLTRCRSGAAEAGIDYVLCSTATAPQDALRDLLVRRAR
jgi:uncharacterized protein (DUF58 family)